MHFRSLKGHKFYEALGKLLLILDNIYHIKDGTSWKFQNSVVIFCLPYKSNFETCMTAIKTTMSRGVEKG
tara:strand:+ start:550 stop:759 length:210 start_codon:yes stop_codon:yes gene_type:complete